MLSFHASGQGGEKIKGRGWNRISFFLMFLFLFAVMLCCKVWIMNQELIIYGSEINPMDKDEKEKEKDEKEKESHDDEDVRNVNRYPSSQDGVSMNTNPSMSTNPNSTNPNSTNPNSTNNHWHEISQTIQMYIPMYRRVYDEYQIMRRNPVNYEEYYHDYLYSTTNRISLATYSPEILQHGCNITVQIMDPRISTSHRGAPAFFTLESVGAFLPHACVVITTSKCQIPPPLFVMSKDDESYHATARSSTNSIRSISNRSTSNRSTSNRSTNSFSTNSTNSFSTNSTINTKVEQALHQHIYNSSLPLFQKMIQRGQVRVNILNHTKYNLKSCHNFYNPSSAMMNIDFWKEDQFINGVDSDVVFIIQHDSVLCNEPNLEYLQRFPYIGALWTQYECNIVKKLWTDFTMQYLNEYRDKEKAGLLSDQDKRPDLVNMTSTIHRYCDKTLGIGAVGNGGFSLRSRSAMVKVIETCPHVSWSGMDLTNRSFPCMVTGELAEDLYFATVLKGLNEPMPNAYEAAVFSVERVWPSEVTNQFGGPTTYAEIVETTRNVMKHVHFAHIKGRIETVPLGFHQQHYFNPKSVTSIGDLAELCPHNPFILDPLEKRNKLS
jgi:hypothetical protein